VSTEVEAQLPTGQRRIQGWVSAGFRMLSQQAFALLSIIWINGVVLRMTVRDSNDLLAPLFYATPWPVLAVFTFGFLRYFWRQPVAVFAVIFVAHMLGAAWIMENWHTPQLSKEPADLRVLQWNVARPVHWRPEIIGQVKTFNADVIAISEPIPTSKEGKYIHRTKAAENDWRAAFPDYSFELRGEDFLCLIRGEVVNRRLGILFPGSPYALYEVRVKDRKMRILQVDIDARPLHPRRKPLGALVDLVGTLSDQPLILIGDFNTPRESVHLEPLQKNLQHAWLTAGAGCAETWPSFLPVLSLDQVWCGYGLSAVRCQHGVTFRSDHRPVFAELRFDGK
jgi:hypothetical protein